MKIHHLRNATCVIETAKERILVDPMICDKGKLPPFSAIRFRPKRNPIVEMPANCDRILQDITHCLVTHSRTFGIKALQHTDHLDSKGEEFLIKQKIPVITLAKDAEYLRKSSINVDTELEYWQPQSFANGSIMAVPARHGHGWNSHLMANGAGFYLELEGEPALYISGDTVYTKDVERVLLEYQPDIAVAAAGGAQLDIGPPILMSLDEVVTFIRRAPGRVVLNHLEALNHCPTTRKLISEILEKENLLEKVLIPDDGETLTLTK